MNTFGYTTIGIIIGIIVIAMNSLYTVRQDQQALVLQFGDPVEVRNEPGTDEAGLYLKLPVAQQVVMLDRKNIGLNISDIEVLASDQRRLVVDAFVRWRINDPLKFYQRLRTESQASRQLDRFTESAIREALGRVPVPEIVSGQRAQLMDRIRETVNNNMGDTGIDIIDVRIRQADLPDQIAEGVYDRMRTARQQEAQRIRSEGAEEAIRIEAAAREESERIRGSGDAQRNAIYAAAYGKDPDFFRFYRSLIACEEAIQDGTRLIVGPEKLDVCSVFSEQAAQVSR